MYMVIMSVCGSLQVSAPMALAAGAILIGAHFFYNM